MDIFSYDSKSRNDEFEDQCLTTYNNDDVLESKGPFTEIVNNLRERYIVDEKPICNARNICYKIANDEYFVQNSKTLTFNRGEDQSKITFDDDSKAYTIRFE